MIIDDNNPANGDFDDDDSFALENLDSYPGNLAAFIDVSPSKADASDTASTVPSADENAYFPQDDVKEESSFQPNLRALEDSFDDAAHEPDEIPQESTDIPSEEEEIDTDDFVRQLQADLERSKAKKVAQASVSEPVQEAEPVKKVEFTSVEDYPGAEEIDLSSIVAHHPSTYLQMEEAEEEVPAFEALPEESDSEYSGYAQMAASMPPEPPTASPETSKQKSDPVQKEKKNRKGLYLLAAASVAILALGFGAYTFYPHLSQMLGSHPAADSTHAEAPKKTEPMPHSPPAKDNHESPDKDVEESHGTDSLGLTAEHHNTAEEKTPEVEHPAEIIKAEPPKPKPVDHDVPKKQEVVKAEPKPAVREHKPPMIARNNSAPTTSEAKPQVYTVQVYSSPSKDDADERLIRLKSRNATNASISEQTIRGQKWYRVRFGAFASRDEAEAAAKQLGFTQCWIDRVR